MSLKTHSGSKAHRIDVNHIIFLTGQCMYNNNVVSTKCTMSREGGDFDYVLLGV